MVQKWAGFNLIFDSDPFVVKHYIGTLLTSYNVPELVCNWPKVDNIGPIPGEFSHIMACLQGINTEGSNIQDW